MFLTDHQRPLILTCSSIGVAADCLLRVRSFVFSMHEAIDLHHGIVRSLIPTTSGQPFQTSRTPHNGETHGYIKLKT